MSTAHEMTERQDGHYCMVGVSKLLWSWPVVKPSGMTERASCPRLSRLTDMEDQSNEEKRACNHDLMLSATGRLITSDISSTSNFEI